MSTRKKRPPSNRKPADTVLKSEIVSVEASPFVVIEEEDKPNIDRPAPIEVKQPIEDELGDMDIFKTSE